MWQKVTAFFAAIAAILGAIAAFEPARESWCTNVGFLCTNVVTSAPITSQTLPGDNCVSTIMHPVCVKPTSKYRRLDTSSIQFKTNKPAGTFRDGNGPAPDTSGWFIDAKKDEVSASQICITVYATTTACEHPQDITGHFTATERLTIF